MATEISESAPTISADVIKQFREIDTPCICEVLEQLHLETMIQGLFPLEADQKICGPAATFRSMPAQEAWAKPWEFTSTTSLITNHCKPGDVVVMESHRTDVSPWGSIVSLYAKTFGCEGLVIEGSIRDVENTLKVDWPVFARSTTARGPHFVTRFACLNSEPVQLGQGATAITVFPGDLIVGDRGGICVIPLGRVDEVLPLAKAWHEKDEATLAKLREELPRSKKWPGPANPQANVPRRTGLGPIK